MKKIYHWLVVICCCGMATATPGILINSAGVFFSPVAQSMGVGLGAVSAYLTIQNMTAGLLGPITVKISRRVNFRLMMLIGTVVCSLCYLGMANVSAVWQMYLLTFLIGAFSTAFVLIWVSTILGNWFSKYAGLVTGLATGFSGIAGALLSPAFNRLIERSGWRSGYLAAALLVVLVMLPALIFVRLHPSELGLPRYGEKTVQAASDPIPAAQRQTAPKKAGGTALLLLALATALGSFITGFGSHFSSYATGIGLSSATGALMISAAMVGNTSSKVLMGMLCDAVGGRRASFAAAGCVIAGCVFLAAFPGAGEPLLLVSAFLVGVSYSIGTVLMSAIAKEVFGLERFSAAYAAILLGSNLGSGFSYSIIGFSYDIFHSFVPMLIFCACLALAFLLLVQIAYRAAKR